MKLLWRVFCVQMNQRIGFSAVRASFRQEPKRALTRTGIFLVALVSIGALSGMYTWLLHAIMPAFQSLGMGEVFLGVTLLLSMIIVFFMGMFYLIGALFFAKDTEFLAALPIPQGTVFAAKFVQVLLGEIGTCALFLIPSFIVYGTAVQVGVDYWARAAIALFFAPCIPLALSGILALLLMRWNALWRRRELLTIIGSVLLVVMTMAGQMLLTSRMPENMTQEAILALISNGSSFLNRIASAFPPSGWAAEGLAQGKGKFLLFVLVSLAALAVVVLLSSRIYYRGALAQTDTMASKRSVSLKGKHMRQRNPMASLFFKEWRIVLRTPVYALNGLIVIILGPLMMLMPILAGGTSGDFSELMNLLNSQVDPWLIALVLTALFMAISTINPAVSTSVSREGKTFYFLKILPISPWKQILSKFFFGQSISILTMLLMGAFALVMLHLSPWIVLLAVALSAIASISVISFSMIPDIVRPKLVWNSETEAIKQNINSMLALLIGWGTTGLSCICVYQLSNHGVNSKTLTIGVAVVYVVLAAFGLLALKKATNRSWKRIEG